MFKLLKSRMSKKIVTLSLSLSFLVLGMLFVAPNQSQAQIMDKPAPGCTRKVTFVMIYVYVPLVGMVRVPFPVYKDTCNN